MKEERFAEAMKRAGAKRSAGLSEKFIDAAMESLPAARERRKLPHFALAAVAAAAILVGAGSLASSLFQGFTGDVAEEKRIFASSLSFDDWEDSTQIELSAIFDEAELVALP